MTRSSLLYRGAAHALGRTVFNSPAIDSVCVRRSVAAGEAVFPFSDLDLDIGVRADSGPVIGLALRRLRLARAVFPRTGQCFVIAPADVDELSDLEPYRASINRRSGIAIRGQLPEWPARRIERHEAARRVVFWLEAYFPASVRSGDRRLQRKCRVEMRNALGLLDRRWSEPRTTQQEVSNAYPPSSTRSLFADGLEAAGSAHAHLGRSAPTIAGIVRCLGLTILPAPDTPWPTDAQGIVVTPAALDLMIQTLRPSLWIDHGNALAELGFEPPPAQTWIRAAWRLASVQWLRGPGFFEPRTEIQEWRLAVADRVLTAIERGGVPTGALPMPSGVRQSAATYYTATYDGLVPQAAALRARARALGANAPS